MSNNSIYFAFASSPDTRNFICGNICLEEELEKLHYYWCYYYYHYYYCYYYYYYYYYAYIMNKMGDSKCAKDIN